MTKISIANIPLLFLQSDEYSLPKIVESNRLTLGGYPTHRIVVIYDKAEEGTYHFTQNIFRYKP